MTNTETVALLETMGACIDAKSWVKAHSRWGSAKLWQACPRADWLLWIAGRIGISRETLVMAACACARLALCYVAPGENRPLQAIETAEAWARGEATIEQVRAASDAAYAAYAASAAASAAASDAAYAAYAASDAASAADAAADAAAYAAFAASAAYAYATYAAAASRKKMQKDCANAVCKIITHDMIMGGGTRWTR